MRKSLVITIVLVLLVSVVGCMREADVVAIVNDEEITQAQLDKIVNLYVVNYKQDSGKDPLKDSQLMKEIRKVSLDNLIEQTVLLQEVKNRKISATQAEYDEALKQFKDALGGSEVQYKGFLKNNNINEGEFIGEVHNRVLITKLMDKVTENVTVTESEMHNYWENNLGKYGKKVKVAHILVKDKKEAESIIEKLNKGASFEQMAKQKSIDPGTKDIGGKLDMVIDDQSQLVPEFLAAALKLNKGEITETPVKTSYGYHIIKGLSVSGDILSYDDSKAQVSEDAKTQKQKDVWAEYVKKLKSHASIAVYLDKK
ncbi:MAG: peptidylprolyl isomerase [Acidobacteriota bacterium]